MNKQIIVTRIILLYVMFPLSHSHYHFPDVVEDGTAEIVTVDRR